jgi:hypothetical protein
MEINIVTGNDADRTLKRKANDIVSTELPITPDRFSPEAMRKHVIDIPISPSSQRTKGRKISANDKRFLSLFDLARCLNESRDYDYPDRSVTFVALIVRHPGLTLRPIA